MNETSFDLIGIFRQIFKKKKFVLSVTIAAGVLSFIFCLLQQERYTSETVFIVKNPLLIDRNYVFRNTSYEHREFFAVPDDIDHIQTIGKSDGLIWHLIGKFDLGKVYNIKNDQKLFKRVKRNYKLKHEDTKNIELYYTDPDPKRAQAIAVAAREYIEEMFRNYFLTTNKDITNALRIKATNLSDSIVTLDDSIKTLRAATGNYSALLPQRGNSISSYAASLSPENAASLERLQELTVLKDQLVKDVANYTTLINEYEVMESGDIRVFYVVQDAYEPGVSSYPQTLIIIGASILGALIFSCFLVLFTGFYKTVMQTK